VLNRNERLLDLLSDGESRKDGHNHFWSAVVNEQAAAYRMRKGVMIVWKFLIRPSDQRQLSTVIETCARRIQKGRSGRLTAQARV
jgi:hypothetical protein